MNRPWTLVASALALVAGSATPTRAELVCEEAQVTLGAVKAGPPLCHRFTFVNRSRETVEITQVQPSCGCLKPKLAEKRLRPGESGVLVLEVNTLTSPAGPNAWRVQLFYSCGGKLCDLTLALRATVVTEITMRPAALVLQTETSVSSTITLTDGRPTPLTPTGVRTSSPMLRAELRESLRDANGRKVVPVRVDVESGFPEGRHDETLQIFTSDPEYPELRVPVTVVKHSRAAVSAMPAEVSLRVAGSGALPARVVRLRGAGGQEVAVEKVESDNPSVRCTWAKGPGDMATLRVLVDRSGVTSKGLHATLRVRLARPVAEVTVPVHCSPN
jgi:hypothetical protein